MQMSSRLNLPVLCLAFLDVWPPARDCVPCANSRLMLLAARCACALLTHLSITYTNSLIKRKSDTRISQDGVSSGVTMQGSVLYPTGASDLKRFLPCARHQFLEMWEESMQRYTCDPKNIGRIIRSAGITRSGSPRVDNTKGEYYSPPDLPFLKNWILGKTSKMYVDVLGRFRKLIALFVSAVACA